MPERQAKMAAWMRSVMCSLPCNPLNGRKKRLVGIGFVPIIIT